MVAESQRISGFEEGMPLMGEQDSGKDIMSELLRGDSPVVVTREENSIEQLTQYLRRLESQVGATPPAGRQGVQERHRRPKKKATYYLSTRVIDQLDMAHGNLVEENREGFRPRLSKSMIVEMAIQAALKDLESKGRKSEIMRMIHTIQKQYAKTKPCRVQASRPVPEK